MKRGMEGEGGCVAEVKPNVLVLGDEATMFGIGGMQHEMLAEL